SGREGRFPGRARLRPARVAGPAEPADVARPGLFERGATRPAGPGAGRRGRRSGAVALRRGQPRGLVDRRPLSPEASLSYVTLEDFQAFDDVDDRRDVAPDFASASKPPALSPAAACALGRP